jgi:hypothetical protein
MTEHRLPEASRPDDTQPSDATPVYAIGYGRAPVHTRFKPGHPKCGGRPKGQRNKRTVVDETLNEKVTVREGNRTRSVTKFHAMILRMMNDAVSGNAKAQSHLIALARSLGLIGEPQETTNCEPFTPDDPAMIADFFRRHGNQAEPTQPPESTENPEAGETEPPSKKTKEIKS